ncbi:MAG: ATP-dependent DNA helicase RecQ, partial [Treponema sp.]|nr:ATP-dependent DNA helicase RecQ [Treponema sp.]
MNEEFYGDEFDGGFQALLGKEGDDEFNRVLLEDETSECEFYEDEAVRTARNAFGVRFLFPWQRIVISNILDSAKNIQSDSSFADNFDDDEFCRGRQIVLLPTGAGKSMCFLVPSLILPGATLIFYPLLALMADQKRRMDEADISCVVLKGGQSEIEREEIFRKIEGKDGSPAKVILANPEVLQNEKILARLSKCDISHVAIDEAHCACEWGDTFRSAYLTLGKIIGKLGVKIVTAFTATASPVVLKRVGEIIFDGHFHLVRGDSDRANIHYSVLHAYAKEKAALECALKMKKPMIIFCGTRGRTENMARILLEVFGREKIRFYHAGMTKEEKHSVEKWFFDSDDGILTATCAYGMGMDKGNIYSVVHLDA